MNYIAILIAAFVNFLLGAIWYSPFMFLKQWMELKGFTKTDTKNNRLVTIIQMIITSLITASILAVVLKITGNMTLTNGLGVGILMWFGFAATAQFTDWAFSGKKKELFFIDTGYLLVGYVLMGAIIGAWK
jgi:hypothetical protein